MTRSAALLLSALWVAGAAQPWTPQDYWTRHTVQEPRISPDGQQVVYLDVWNDRAANRSCANLLLVPVRGQQTRTITEGAWRDRSPRWSPDSSRIAWISGQGGIRVFSRPSGQESTIVAGEAESFAWSADGRFLAYTTASALLVVPIAGGEARNLTPGGFQGVGEPAWMPDGKSVLIAGADGEIYAVRVADSSIRRFVTEPGRKDTPLPSPDGSKVAWISTDPTPRSYSIRKLFVMNADGSRVKALAGALDRDPEWPQWSSDSRTIYFIADDSGATHIFASRADSTLRQVTRQVERLSGFSLADNGRAVTVRATEHAVDVITLTVDLPSTPAVIASPMENLLSERETGAVEEIHADSGGKTVQGWLVKPPGFDAAKQYPLLLDIADAPRRMYGPEFSIRVQILAARGWLVLCVNPRGTPGYGEQFGRLLPTRYPGDDADDLLAALDSVAGRNYVDRGRVAVIGGLLTAWLIGHSERFTAAVARQPIVDFTLFATGKPQEALSRWGAMPWDDPELYMQRSPIYFAKNWKTPTLVLAEQSDPQADEMAAALAQRAVRFKLVRVPDAAKPAGAVAELETTLAWLDAVK